MAGRSPPSSAPAISTKRARTARRRSSTSAPCSPRSPARSTAAASFRAGRRAIPRRSRCSAIRLSPASCCRASPGAYGVLARPDHCGSRHRRQSQADITTRSRPASPRPTRSTCSATSPPRFRRSSSSAPACAGPTTTSRPAFRRKSRTAARSSADFLGALTLTDPVARAQLLSALAVPGAANIPPSIFFPVPVFGLTFQATPGDARFDQNFKDNGFTWRALRALPARIPTPASTRSTPAAAGPKCCPRCRRRCPGAGGALRSSPIRRTSTASRSARRPPLLDRRLYLDGALFYYKYKNFQTTEQVGTFFVTSNAGKADSYGFEGQARYRASRGAEPLRQLRLQPRRFKSGVFDGNRFRLSPDHTFSAGGTFAADVAGRPARFHARRSPISRRSSSITTTTVPTCRPSPNGKIVADTVQDELQKGFALVSARLGYTFSGGGSGSRPSSRMSSTRNISRTRAIPATRSAWRPSSPASRGPTASS